MRIEPNRCRIGVDIEAVAREPGNVRAHQFAAERQHESIVGQDLPAARRHYDHLLSREIDGLNPRDQMVDADRIQHLGERDRDVRSIS